MAGLWKRAMEVLGLSDGDTYGDFEAYEDQGPPSPVRRGPVNRADPEGIAGVKAVVQPTAHDVGGSGVGGVSVLPRRNSVTPAHLLHKDTSISLPCHAMPCHAVPCLSGWAGLGRPGPGDGHRTARCGQLRLARPRRRAAAGIPHRKGLLRTRVRGTHGWIAGVAANRAKRWMPCCSGWHAGHARHPWIAGAATPDPLRGRNGMDEANRIGASSRARARRSGAGCRRR